MHKILLTGATGFVGSALARTLQQAGFEVRLLVRKNSDQYNVSNLDVEVVFGDLRQPDSLKQALKGCRGLFHAAADYRLWARRPAVLYDTNVKGTCSLMLAALDAGVERIVYTSSVATLGARPDRQPADEQTPGGLEQMVGHYKRSKYLAEQAVSELINQQQLPAVIVNPSAPVGPRDIKPTPTGRMIRDAAAGRMPAYIDSGLNVVHVDDVAEGHLLSYHKGQVGERYVLGGENMSLKQVFSEVAQIAGQKPPRVKLPVAPLFPLAVCAELWGQLSGVEPRVTRDALKMAKKPMFFSSHKAQEQLGYQPRPAKLAFRDAVDWFAARPE